MASSPAPQAANQNNVVGTILNASGNPIHGGYGAPSGPANPINQSPPGGGGGDPMVDIGKLQTHVGWLAKGLIGLATVSAVVLAWLIVNLYGPMHDLATNVAVQTAAIGDMKERLADIKDRMDRAGDDAKAAAQHEKAPRHPGR